MRRSVSCCVLPLAVRKRGVAFSFPIAGRLDVGREVFREVVVRRHLVALATLLVEPHPPAAPLHVVVFDIHSDRGPHAGERVRHERDERPIAKPHDARLFFFRSILLHHGLRNLDAVEQHARLVCGEDRRLALLRRVPRTADRCRRVERHNLADHEPIEEHAYRGERLLHGRSREILTEHLDVGRDVHRTYPLEREPSSFAPAEKIRTRAVIRAARVRVPDVGGEEFQEPEAGIFAGGQNDGGHAVSAADLQVSVRFLDQSSVHVSYMITSFIIYDRRGLSSRRNRL
jgi:hypothetical protein